MIWLKLSKSEISLENEIDMKSFDVYEYLQYLGQFGKIEENLNVMRDYLNEKDIKFGKHDPANLEEVSIWTQNLLQKDKSIKELAVKATSSYQSPLLSWNENS